MKTGETTKVERLIDRLEAGDAAARDELIQATCDRLRRMARNQLKQHPAVKRWEDTDDVLQNAAIRLWRALAKAPPESLRHYFNLAGKLIRNELIDLLRRHTGAHGLGANYETNASSPGEKSRMPMHDRGTTTSDPAKLAEWTEFHKRIEALPKADREMFDLLWYQKLTQAEAAKLLGVSDREVRRRWQSARVKLGRELHGELPGR